MGGRWLCPDLKLLLLPFIIFGRSNIFNFSLYFLFPSISCCCCSWQIKHFCLTCAIFLFPPISCCCCSYFLADQAFLLFLLLSSSFLWVSPFPCWKCSAAVHTFLLPVPLLIFMKRYGFLLLFRLAPVYQSVTFLISWCASLILSCILKGRITFWNQIFGVHAIWK